MKKNTKSTPQTKIAASILAGDFGRLADDAKRIEDSGANYLHIDIMDGHFVPNITMGPQAVAAINRATNMFLDVHLMIYNPFEYVERFIESGADNITFHFEATEDIEEVISYIKRCNVRASLAFNPETSMSLIPKYLDQVDMVLLMTVHPGFGGQEFIYDVLDKVRFVRESIDKLNINIDIEVDGGINEKTAQEAREAGANVIVAGTYLFNAKNMREAVTTLRGTKQ
jgi:ribulose-phosphate 3-epimerase